MLSTRRLTLAAFAVYLFWSFMLMRQNPGLQYDEALMVLGTVHMRNSPAELTLPHDPDTWFCARGRCLPLMTVRYVGAAKEYLTLPLFAALGTKPKVLRLVSVLMGLVGIWGLVRLVGFVYGEKLAAWTAWVLAMHPAYVDLTVFDNGAVGVFFASMGACAIALEWYLKRRTLAAALTLGFAVGVGVWCRTNFAWVVGAVVVALLLVMRKKAVPPVREMAAMAVGGLVGLIPFVLYQVISGGGTFEAVSMFTAPGTFAEQLIRRASLFTEVVLSDFEHRAMWDGPAALPLWQKIVFPVLVLGACAWGVRKRSIAAIAFLVLAAPLFLSRLPVSEHHLLALIPFAAVFVPETLMAVAARGRWFKATAVLVSILYLATAFYWQASAVRGLKQTGGVREWSNGISKTAEYLEQNHQKDLIRVLDWGLQNNLYVLTAGRLHTLEMFGSGNVNWAETVKAGGVFLINSEGNRYFPADTEAFLKTVAELRPRVERTTLYQGNGAGYAEVVNIEPDSIGKGVEQGPTEVSGLPLGAPEWNGKIEGFHNIEEGAWRWTKQNFEILFPRPEGNGSKGKISVKMYVPDVIMQKLGPVTLSAKAGDIELPKMRLGHAGEFTYQASVNVGADGVKVAFTLDKAMGPNGSDPRELGVIVSSAGMEWMK